MEHRWALERRFATVTVGGHDIAVKIGSLDGETVNVKPEHRDCVRVAELTGRSVKSVWAQALAAAQGLPPSGSSPDTNQTSSAACHDAVADGKQSW